MSGSGSYSTSTCSGRRIGILHSANRSCAHLRNKGSVAGAGREEPGREGHGGVPIRDCFCIKMLNAKRPSQTC